MAHSGTASGTNSQVFDGGADSCDVSADATINNIFDGGGTVAVWVKVESDGGANTGAYSTRGIVVAVGLFLR